MMKVVGAAGLAIGAAAVVAVIVAGESSDSRAAALGRKVRPHFDHAAVIPASFASPQDVTRKCLECHPQAVDVMKTPHWLWLGEPVPVPPSGRVERIGKKNLINNFCIATRGNERACTKCHAGYGWRDDSFDFNKADNIDCLVCHEHTGTYVKGEAGMPAAGTDLVAAARSVGTPGRDNCLTCHAFGGGGEAVKHGDIDSSLIHPAVDEDVHIGRYGFLCVDCHAAPHHQIRGRAFSVSVEDSNGVACTDCHKHGEHKDPRLDAHLGAVACQTCHLPTFARTIPTKATWDWSKAGDSSRPEDPHHYLKIKGEFTYEQDVIPEYRWFNRSVDRYLLGDHIDPRGVTDINAPRGSWSDKTARIWPFKVHRALQPYDVENRYLLPPLTGGTNGYWTNFDWPSSLKLGAEKSGLAFSGKYGFAKTEMFWPLTHMVVPKEQALGCTDCHGEHGRLDWKALGYAGDPIETGGRR
jgi:octaheme c-type cytochrome (tetrathionate reductase family)